MPTLGGRHRGLRVLVATAISISTLAAAEPTSVTLGYAFARPGAAPVTAAATTPDAQRNIVRSRALHTAPGSAAAVALAKTPRSETRTRTLLGKIAGQPQAVWFGDWLSPAKARTQAASLVAAAKKANKLLPVVLYNIPFRDCHGYSAGGAKSDAAYRTWVDQVAAGLAGGKVVAVLEPDALPHLDCLTGPRQSSRLALLRYAVAKLTKTSGIAVYLDAGHNAFKPAATMAARLEQAGIDQAAGFALNVANFQTTADEVAYGRQVSAASGGAHFVIDVSRNGNGPWTGTQSWCNPPGRALGARPTTSTGDPLLDASLWVKTIGLSDGTCRVGAPKAGVWWQAYAIGLASRARW
ncbi:glycoside hydrolase family 6 protein [Cryptosporangium aurantiacum]|uniref:Glucanase n=1 Tax=Cryptosporangium aurantiacum TaxID=134849 RepID=A0A1M7RDS3_9ACTN|nr:glycoside hydrolase family 6 protein [Cryptosporangium aurantiacum]SHN44188.1 endoglucanase [Cryptosporangium aurantiacum]